MRRCIRENELQNVCGTPRSVGGGVKLSGLSAFRASFSGPGLLALAIASALCGCWAFAGCPPAKAAPATASVVVPRSRRREKIPPARRNPLGRPARSLSDMKISFVDAVNGAGAQAFHAPWLVQD